MAFLGFLSEPENDNFVEVVTEMRKSLAWVAELPRHGPGCRAEMEKLYENPGEKEEDEDSEVSIYIELVGVDLSPVLQVLGKTSY